MKILVTGATGLIGCHAAAALREAGHTVRLLVRDASRLDVVFAPFGLSGGDFEVSRGALEDEGALDEALRGCTGLLHCAGRFSPDRRDAAALRETNVEGTRRVLDAAEQARADAVLERVVYVSSILALFPAPGPKMRTPGRSCPLNASKPASRTFDWSRVFTGPNMSITLIDPTGSMV